MTAIKHLIQSTFKRLGYQLVRVDAVPKPLRPSFGWSVLFSTVQQLGFAPNHIIDVGANRGRFTRQAIQFFPDASYTLVEPQDHLKTHVQDLIDRGCKIRWINAGAGDKPGTLPFTVSCRDDGSGFWFSQQQAEGAGYQQIAVEVKTLNDIVASGHLPPPDMVKIDAEGLDLKVLSGASDLLGKTDLFLVEAIAFSGHWENTISAVIGKMTDAGYRLIDITDLNRSPKTGVLWLCELAFMRTGCPLLGTANVYE